MSRFDKYFSEAFGHLRPDVPDISELLKGERLWLIVGDFYGIQKFIFEGLATKNASKVLRARSAYIQIFTRVLAYRICDELDIDIQNILSTAAGKFEILSPVDPTEVLPEIAQKVDDHFIGRFYGLSGIGLTSVPCQISDFTDTGSYRRLRDTIAAKVEEGKFAKFSLPARKSVLDYEEGLDNASLCRLCNLRKITHKEDRCDLCHDMVRLGEKLAKADTLAIVSDEAEIPVFDGYGVAFSENHPFAIGTFAIAKEKSGEADFWPISSYVCKDDEGAIVDFEELAKRAIREKDGEKRGVEALAVLKADVDDMGRFIRERDVTDSFENFATFSKGLDNFFSIEVPALMAKEYKDTYTIFAGGDDLFLIGAWHEMLDLAKDITDEFERFTKKELTLSLGIILVKPNTPVNYLARKSEEALESSKEMAGKAAITLFGETAKIKEYRKEGNAFCETLKLTDTETMELPAAFMYRLLELLDMRMYMKKDTNFFEGSMWKSKLNYAFRRNLFEKLGEDSKRKLQAQELLKACNDMIENYPEVARMVLSEFIYKRRKAS